MTGRRVRRWISLLLAALLCAGPACCAEAPSGPRVVGEDVGFGDVTEFYYTYSASTAPPFYQRYHFYIQDGAWQFYHETREGGGWPQTEADITASGTLELTAKAVERLRACLEGGSVRPREDALVDGDAGPWLYLYWNGDGGDVQEYAFASYGARLEFEDFCAALRDSAEDSAG